MAEHPNETPLGVGADGVLRVCYDLNVFYSAFLNDRRGRTGTHSQMLLDALERGTCPLGPLQLVVSKSMTTHLAKNLQVNLGVSAEAAVQFTEALEAVARVGPQGIAPIVFSGPTGFTGVLDPDVEDSRVLETALAAHAHVMVTSDRHFVGPRPMPARTIPIPEGPGAMEYEDGESRIFIVRPERFLHWWIASIDEVPHRSVMPSPILPTALLFESHREGRGVR